MSATEWTLLAGTTIIIITIIAIIAICIAIHQNTGERGAAKRAEWNHRYQKFYEIKDEVDEIERDLNKVNADIDAQYRATKKTAYMDDYERWKAKRLAEQKEEP